MHSALNFIVSLYNAVCTYEHDKKNLDTNRVGRKADVYNLKKAILESAGLSHEEIENIINGIEPQSVTGQLIQSKIPAGYFIDYVRLRSDMLTDCARLRTGLLNRSELRGHLSQVLAQPAHSKENLLRDMITDRDEAIKHLNDEVNFLRNQHNAVNQNSLNPVSPFFQGNSIKNTQPVIVVDQDKLNSDSPIGSIETNDLKI